ncbi:RHS repeat protein [Galbibacter sp. EGI 63066]|uniref:RHS repeat domain-containing protein n=1 Tax=Galbibacter sp. EGI 63066 TaxID=2993559 RepID=UPI002248CEDD|nr:RHS repeat domain-containing protein [Galbibacter sp. EGI 63066]MCX2680046.1 RHS repeat protein [Galbibacter sp. EGI 63066]
MKIFQKIREGKNDKILTAFNEKGDKIYEKRNDIEEWFVFKNGLYVKTIRSDGYEKACAYNSEKKPIHTIDTEDYRQWWEYDENGRIKIYKELRGSFGYEEHNKYHPNGFPALHVVKDYEGDTHTHHFDDQGNLIYYKSEFFELEEWWEYNSDGKETYHKFSSGEKLFEYDEKGRLVSSKTGDGHIETWAYDQADRLIQFKNSSGYEKIYKYDERGNQVYLKDILPDYLSSVETSTGEIPTSAIEEWQEFNDENLLVHFKDSRGHEEWFTYDAYGNETFYQYTFNGKTKKITQTQNLYYEQLTEDTEWLFPFKQL